MIPYRSTYVRPLTERLGDAYAQTTSLSIYEALQLEHAEASEQLESLRLQRADDDMPYGDPDGTELDASIRLLEHIVQNIETARDLYRGLAGQADYTKMRTETGPEPLKWLGEHTDLVIIADALKTVGYIPRTVTDRVLLSHIDVGSTSNDLTPTHRTLRHRTKTEKSIDRANLRTLIDVLHSYLVL